MTSLLQLIGAFTLDGIDLKRIKKAEFKQQCSKNYSMIYKLLDHFDLLRKMFVDLIIKLQITE